MDCECDVILRRSLLHPSKLMLLSEWWLMHSYSNSVLDPSCQSLAFLISVASHQDYDHIITTLHTYSWLSNGWHFLRTCCSAFHGMSSLFDRTVFKWLRSRCLWRIVVISDDLWTSSTACSRDLLIANRDWWRSHRMVFMRNWELGHRGWRY